MIWFFAGIGFMLFVALIAYICVLWNWRGIK